MYEGWMMAGRKGRSRASSPFVVLPSCVPAMNDALTDDGIRAGSEKHSIRRVRRIQSAEGDQAERERRELLHIELSKLSTVRVSFGITLVWLMHA